jgi:peptidoglycan/xylan/chitin deacetylase (PgdA/CDA1 family)
MVRNFIFHRVSPHVEDVKLTMDLKHFEKCIRHISEKYNVILLEDFGTNSFTPDKRKSFATLSFDDGYKDNLDYAVPVLEKYNCKGSFYVVSKCVEEQKPLWVHELEYYFKHTHVLKIDLQFDFLPANLKTTRLPELLSQRMQYFKNLKSWLIKTTTAQKEMVYELLCNNLNDVEIERIVMNWQELSQLRTAGHYIGAHSHTHNSLINITSDEELTSEFELPLKFFKEKLGFLPVSFAYPFGFCNSRVKLMAKNTGYQLGLAAQWHQLYDVNKHDSFEIPRIALSNEPWWKTKMRISNKIEIIKSVINYKSTERRPPPPPPEVGT